jgi:hypothetical protein
MSCPVKRVDGSFTFAAVCRELWRKQRLLSGAVPI